MFSARLTATPWRGRSAASPGGATNRAISPLTARRCGASAGSLEDEQLFDLFRRNFRFDDDGESASPTQGREDPGRFMHMAWERLTLIYAILVPPALVLIFVAIMAFESEYVHWLRESFFRTGT